MINEKLLNDLEEILNGSIDPVMFPYQKGNSLRIGKYAIRLNKGRYKIFNCETNALEAIMFCKSSAVALAKTLSKGHETKQIHDIDRHIQKWYNDCVFYKYTMRKTKDDLKYDVVATRYDIARENTDRARQRLDKYIYA